MAKIIRQNIRTFVGLKPLASQRGVASQTSVYGNSDIGKYLSVRNLYRERLKKYVDVKTMQKIVKGYDVNEALKPIFKVPRQLTKTSVQQQIKTLKEMAERRK